MKLKEFKRWFADLGIMLKPYWKYGKLYSFIYIVWSAGASSISTMLYVIMMEVTVNMLAAGEDLAKSNYHAYNFFISRDRHEHVERGIDIFLF